MSDTSAPAGTMRTYQYAARGHIPEDVTSEVKRAHDLQNVLVAAERAYEAVKAALWEEDPEVAPLLAARAQANEAALDADSAVKACNQRLGAAKKAGDRALGNQLREELTVLRAQLAGAKAAREAAREAVKDIKGRRWHVAQAGIERAARARDEQIKAALKEAGTAGLFWATIADTKEHHVTAATRVRAARMQGGPAQLRFQRWDGTGTITVQVQRERGVTAQDRTRLGALRAARLEPREISIALGAGITAREALPVAALRNADLDQQEITTALAAGVTLPEALALSVLYDAALGPEEISTALAAGTATLDALALSFLRDAGFTPQAIPAAFGIDTTTPLAMRVLACEDEKQARSAATQALVRQALAEGHPERSSVRASLATLACEDEEQARSAALAALAGQALAEGRLPGARVQAPLAVLACGAGKEARSAALAALTEQTSAEGRLEGSTWEAQTVARMKVNGPETQGQPPASAQMLASEASPWKGVLQLTPGPRADFSQLPRGERRRIARNHQLAMRLGAGEHKATVQVPVTVHRQMGEQDDVKWARLTVRACGPDLEMSASFPARVPAPPLRRQGRVVCAHLGWRALPDGCLRVAVIAGAGPLPEGLARPGGKDAQRGNLDGVVRPLPDGAGWEVVIPASWRDHDTAIEQLRGPRDIAFAKAREQAAQWLEEHPQDSMLPPHAEGPEAVGEEGARTREDEEHGRQEPQMPSPGRLRQWRAIKGLMRLAGQCASGVHGDEARELGALLAPWVKEATRAWREEARRRRNLIRRRDDAWAKVAAWLVAEAREVRIDEWNMPQLIRRPGSGADADPQAAAARANRVLAAPGELRRRLGITAGFAGTTVTEWKLPEDAEGHRGAQSHAGCDGDLDPEGRREGVMITCLACGAKVDQDVNMLQLMAAPQAATPPAAPAMAAPSA